MTRSKDSFFRKLKELNSIPEELLKLINCEDSGFYELCQKYLDIALNAPKVRSEDGKVAGIFQYDDIDVAKQATIEYVVKHEISNIEPLMHAIEIMHTYSKIDGDSRQVSAFDENSDQASDSVRFYGTLYDFTRIPSDTFKSIQDNVIEAYGRASIVAGK